MIKNNKIFNPKVLLGAFGLFMFLIILCSFIKKTKKNEIIKTYLCYSFPVFKSDASYFLIYDSIALIQYKNYMLFEFKDIYTLQNDTAIVKKTINYKYFLLKKNELYGFYYDSLNTDICKKFKKDSILSKKAFYGQSLFNSSKMLLLNFKKNENSYNLIEKYKCKSKIDLTYPDTMIVYYTNQMKNVDFTLSKELDSIKKLKVQKIRAIYNSQFIKGTPNKFPAYEYKFELKKDTITNLEKYSALLKKNKILKFTP